MDCKTATARRTGGRFAVVPVREAWSVGGLTRLSANPGPRTMHLSLGSAMAFGFGGGGRRQGPIDIQRRPQPSKDDNIIDQAGTSLLLVSMIPACCHKRGETRSVVSLYQ
jgi:hypothetical protein